MANDDESPLTLFVGESDGPRFFTGLGHAYPIQYSNRPTSLDASSTLSLTLSGLAISEASASASPIYSTRSPSSTTSRRDSVFSLARTSTTSSASSAPLQSILEPLGPLMDPPPGAWECPITFACTAWFQPEDYANWKSHSESHFSTILFPRHVRCFFCDVKFQKSDRRAAWTQFMTHMANHFRNGSTIADARPDFELVNHMFHHKVIGRDTYDRLCRVGNERPQLEGFQRHEDIPEELKEKEKKKKRQENGIVVKDPRRRRK